MNFNELRYIVAESELMLRRRRGANMISILIMGLSLLILVVFILVTLNISGVIEKTTEEHRVYVYLRDGISRAASRDIQYGMLGMEGVEEVSFVTRSEALTEFREALGDDSGFLEDLVDNPLPESFRVKLKPDYIRSDVLDHMASQVADMPGVEEVRYGKRWLGRGEALVRGFYMVDFGLGLIILLSVIFVISNTVRLTVLHRKKTINVMKLVGATNNYVRTPFVIEGALQAVAAALIAMGLLALIYIFMKRYLPGIIFFRGEAIAAFVIFCALLGSLVSYTAMRRYLKI